MTISTLPAVILNHNSGLTDAVGGYVFTNSGEAVEYAAGKLGNCATKTGGSPLVRHTNEDIPLLNNFAGDFSIFGWIRHMAASGTKTADLYARGPTNLNIVGPGLTFNTVDSISAVAKINNVTEQTITHTGTGIGNAWHLVALTRRASDNRFRLYFDGTLDVEWTPVTFAPQIKNGEPVNDALPTCILRFWVNGMSTAITQHDETGIFAAEIPAADVAYIYNSGIGRAYATWESPTAEAIRVEQVQRWQLLK